MTVRQRGGYADYQYINTFFNLDPSDPNDFDIAVVNGFTVHSSIGGHPVGFDAEGYSSSGVKVVEKINASNPAFAIFADDFLDLDLFGLANVGQSHAATAALSVGPFGTRFGWPFWYSATVPFIDRDLADICDPGPNSYYRLPWEDGHTEPVGQGNSSGPNDSHAAGTSQEFAFDFGLNDGVPIHAARGGMVQWLTDLQTTNFDPNDPPSNTNQEFPAGALENWGNAVRIAHQDGTTGWYFHIKTNTVSVNVGNIVIRGQPIAEADNTGRSSGSHLHFQVQDNNVNWGQSIQIRFDTKSHGSCYLPQTGDSLVSNNVNCIRVRKQKQLAEAFC